VAGRGSRAGRSSVPRNGASSSSDSARDTGSISISYGIGTSSGVGSGGGVGGALGGLKSSSSSLFVSSAVGDEACTVGSLEVCVCAEALNVGEGATVLGSRGGRACEDTGWDVLCGDGRGSDEGESNDGRETEHF